MRVTDTITVVEGYEAVRIFLETVRRRHDEMADELDFILAGLRWADGTPVDPAMWEDWLAAVKAACARRTRSAGN
jgi:hypothetical protein